MYNSKLAQRLITRFGDGDSQKAIATLFAKKGKFIQESDTLHRLSWNAFLKHDFAFCDFIDPFIIASMSQNSTLNRMIQVIQAYNISCHSSK